MLAFLKMVFHILENAFEKCKGAQMNLKYVLTEEFQTL